MASLVCGVVSAQYCRNINGHMASTADYLARTYIMIYAQPTVHRGDDVLNFLAMARRWCLSCCLDHCASMHCVFHEIIYKILVDMRFLHYEGADSSSLLFGLQTPQGMKYEVRDSQVKNPASSTTNR